MCESELFMLELTPLEDSYFAIDLWTINTPFLSETIGVDVTQSVRGVSLLCLLQLCVLSYGGARVVELLITAMDCSSLREGHKHMHIKR